MTSMTPERWQRLAAILDDALDLPVRERDAYLAGACGDDAELRAEIEALIAADAASGGFLEQPFDVYLSGGTDGDGSAAAEGGSSAGLRVGPYRLVREVAHGGMGAVYLAERADGQFEQQVALKLVRGSMDSDEIRHRFLAERQILARLNHPHIARLLDGGIAADGRPWFAMEFVPGEPITSWCDAHRLTLDARLALFEQACDAVRYAHRSLVVHRDLKPSNILVTGDGQVKLLDFGIAKLLEPTADEVGVTRTETRVLTPEYAAPEQVRGEPITTSTDVYALGALLYELLSGRRAHRFERRTPAEVERVVCETDPEPPSAAFSRGVGREGDPTLAGPGDPSAARAAKPERLRKALAGDLDTITLTALRKDPARRYPSVEALLQDVQRYGTGLPITARRDALGYKLRKFLRRHRLGVAAGGALCLALLGGIGATLLQVRATAREATKARAVKDFVVSLFQVSDPAQSRGRDITARELLERGVRRVDSSLGSQPQVEEELLGVLGTIYRQLGLYPQADTLLSRAVDIARSAYGADHPEAGARLADLATVLSEEGELAPAESLLREALRIRSSALGSDDSDVTVTMDLLAGVLRNRGRIPESESLERGALARDIRRFGQNNLTVATDLDNLGVLLGDAKGDLDAADSAYRAALAIRQRLLDPGHPDVLTSQYNVATNLEDRGNYAAAESLFRVVLRGYRRMYPEGHPDVAITAHSLATDLEALGRYAEAESLEVEALDLRRRLLGPTNPTTLQTVNNLAVTRYRMGKLAGAEVAFREVSATWTAELGANHPNSMTAVSNLGAVLSDEGKYAEAEPLLRSVLARRRQVYGDTSLFVAQTLRLLGVLLHRTGRYAEAEHVLREALAVDRSTLSADHPRIAEVETDLGALLTDRRRAAEAEVMLREALGIREAKMGPQELRTAETREALGLALAALGRRRDAEPLLLASYATFTASPWAARQAGECRARLRRFYQDWGRPAEAARYATSRSR
jgi:serine/threonine protein kinase/uncharacterized protein HemY